MSTQNEESHLIETCPTDYDPDVPMTLAVVGATVEIKEGRRVLTFKLDDEQINQRLTAEADLGLLTNDKLAKLMSYVGVGSMCEVTFTANKNGPQKVAAIHPLK